MRRAIALLFAMALLAIVPAAPVAAVSKICPTLQTEFQAFDGNNQTILLGHECGTALSGNGDSNFGDTVGGFQGSDNNKMNSWAFYNPTFQAWCLVIYDMATADKLVYTLGHSDTWWGPSGGNVGTFSNKASRVVFYQKGGIACS